MWYECRGNDQRDTDIIFRALLGQSKIKINTLVLWSTVKGIKKEIPVCYDLIAKYYLFLILAFFFLLCWKLQLFKCDSWAAVTIIIMASKLIMCKFMKFYSGCKTNEQIFWSTKWTMFCHISHHGQIGHRMKLCTSGKSQICTLLLLKIAS